MVITVAVVLLVKASSISLSRQVTRFEAELFGRAPDYCLLMNSWICAIRRTLDLLAPFLDRREVWYVSRSRSPYSPFWYLQALWAMFNLEGTLEPLPEWFRDIALAVGWESDGEIIYTRGPCSWWCHIYWGLPLRRTDPRWWVLWFGCLVGLICKYLQPTLTDLLGPCTGLICSELSVIRLNS